jgi:hypothetical protein
MAKRNSQNDYGVNKYYILTRPAKLSELPIDEIEDAYDNDSWRDKSRRLQARRWRKIRRQLV